MNKQFGVECSLNLSAQLWRNVQILFGPNQTDSIEFAKNEKGKKTRMQREQRRSCPKKWKEQLITLIHVTLGEQENEKSLTLCHIMLEITSSIITLDKLTLSRISRWLDLWIYRQILLTFRRIICFYSVVMTYSQFQLT